MSVIDAEQFASKLARKRMDKEGLALLQKMQAAAEQVNRSVKDMMTAKDNVQAASALLRDAIEALQKYHDKRNAT